MMPMDGVTVKMAAEILGCSYGTIQKYCKKGLLPSTKILGRLFIPIQAVIEFDPPRGGRPRKYATDEEAAANRACVAVYKAVRAGLIERKPCEICGGLYVEAHHEDYATPLEVRWLCRKCHRRFHAGLIDLPNLKDL